MAMDTGLISGGTKKANGIEVMIVISPDTHAGQRKRILLSLTMDGRQLVYVVGPEILSHLIIPA